MNGEHSIQWKAAAIVWESVNRIKDQTFAAMHWTNRRWSAIRRGAENV